MDEKVHEWPSRTLDGDMCQVVRDNLLFYVKGERRLQMGEGGDERDVLELLCELADVAEQLKANEKALEFLANIASSDGANCPYHALDHHGEAIYDDCLECDTTEENAIKCWIKMAKEKSLEPLW